MIRTVLVFLSIVIFLILSIPLFAVEWIIGKFSPRARDISQLRILQGFMRFALFLAGTKVTVIGKEKIPTEEPVLYVANHRSYFDIPLLYINCPGPTGFIAKMQLKRIPILNWWVTRLHGFFLDRENIREGMKVILAAIDGIKNGISCAICPEGTRGKEGSDVDMLPFHEGSFKIATKTGCLIVPVSITNSSDVFEDHMPSVHAVPVIVEFGDPIDPKTLEGDAKKFPGRYVHGIMTETLKKNRQALEAK